MPRSKVSNTPQNNSFIAAFYAFEIKEESTFSLQIFFSVDYRCKLDI